MSITNKRGYCGIGLHSPKNNINVASVLRASGCYNASFVATTGKRYEKSSVDTQSRFRHAPLFHTDDLKDIIPYGCVPVAVELIEGAQDLTNYKHPESAFYIFGPEEGSLGKKTTDWCRDVIYIPTDYCMNLAATVNVVLYDRLAKQNRK